MDFGDYNYGRGVAAKQGGKPKAGNVQLLKPEQLESDYVEKKQTKLPLSSSNSRKSVMLSTPSTEVYRSTQDFS